MAQQVLVTATHIPCNNTYHPPHFWLDSDGMKGSCCLHKLAPIICPLANFTQCNILPHFHRDFWSVETGRNLAICLISPEVATCKKYTRKDFLGQIIGLFKLPVHPLRMTKSRSSQVNQYKVDKYYRPITTIYLPWGLE